MADGESWDSSGSARPNADTDVTVYAIDMGGGEPSVSIIKDISPTLATTHYGEPAAYDARGNGGVYMPNDHRGASKQSDRLHRPCFVENHYGDYRPSSQSNSIRANGATLGGGGEVVILEYIQSDEP